MSTETSRGFITPLAPAEIRKQVIARLPSGRPVSHRIGTALEKAGEGLHPAIKPERPLFLLSDDATQRFVDSLKRFMQNDVAIGLIGPPHLIASNLANEALDEEAVTHFSERSLYHRVDLINQTWQSIVDRQLDGILGDPAASALLESLPPILKKIYSMPELRAAAMLIAGTELDAERQLLVFIASASLAWGENQGNRNAVYIAGPRDKPSSAAGLWATLKGSDPFGAKQLERIVNPETVLRTRAFFEQANPQDAQYGWTKIAGGVGVILFHDEMIRKEWQFNGTEWIPHAKRLSYLHDAYRHLLDDYTAGYSWLQTIYHINGSALPLSAKITKDRVSKDYVFASTSADNAETIADLYESYINAVPRQSSQKSSLTASVAAAFGPTPEVADKLEGSSSAGVATSYFPKDAPESGVSGTRAPAIISKWNPMRRYFNKKMNKFYNRPHRGIDLRIVNQPLYAPAPGYLTNSGFDGDGYGYWIEIAIPEFQARYRLAHLKKFDPQKIATLKRGFQRGEQLGISGATGNAEAPHLHLEYYPFVRAGGKTMTSGPADPQSDKNEAWKLFTFKIEDDD